MVMSAGSGHECMPGYSRHSATTDEYAAAAHALHGAVPPTHPWSGVPLGMVACVPPAPRLNAALPRLEHPYMHFAPGYNPWYPPLAAMPLPSQGPYGAQGIYAPAPWGGAMPSQPFGAPPPGWYYGPWAAPTSYAVYDAPHTNSGVPGMGVPPNSLFAPPMEHAADPEFAPLDLAPPPDERSKAALEHKPAVLFEDSAVSLASFGAEAVWRLSATLLELGTSAENRSSDPEPRTHLAAPRPKSPSELAGSDSALSPMSPMSLCESELFASRIAASSDSSLPSTPSSGPTSPMPTSEDVSDRMRTSLDSLRLEEKEARPTALHRLVRAMGTAPGAFPSLDACVAVHAPESSARRGSNGHHRPRTPLKHSGAFQGEVSPAFRHFTHQVLVQIQLSPAALFLALYYIQMLPDAITGAGSTCNDAETALVLLAQPTSTAPFKLLTLGLMMANKFLDDNTFLNKTWHEVTGIPLQELSQMELYFLCRTQFRLSLSDPAWIAHLRTIREQGLGFSDGLDDSGTSIKELVRRAVDPMLC
ncbi:hypothetical protein MVES1_001241 [Malassezia vespertilionis]|nr:uncharacterized protein MVES1_001241 [Malassezia vespertilionis]WFD05907.1 hypothetical protein MVES1_001241 [Malassezia vespertilionis]